MVLQKYTDSPTQLLNDRVKEATDRVVIKMNEGAEAFLKETRKAKAEIEKVKDDIHFERGFRKFMFWVSPVLAVFKRLLLQ